MVKTRKKQIQEEKAKDSVKKSQNETEKSDSNESSKAKLKSGQKRSAPMEISQKKNAKNPSSAKKAKRKDSAEAGSSVQPKVDEVNVNVMEDDQLFTMEVNQAEDSYGRSASSNHDQEYSSESDDESEDEVDHEISFKSSSFAEEKSDQESEGELSNYEEDEIYEAPRQRSATPRRSKSPRGSSKQASSQQANSNRSKIQRIDREVKRKLEELHALMSEGGMEESANEIKKSLRKVEKRGKRVQILSPTKSA